MKRLLTLATSGLFATGLAILPVSVFAQPAATTATTDMKPAAPAKVVTHDAKVAPSKDAPKEAAVSKDSAKPATTTHSSVTTPATGATAKTATHGAS